MPHIIPTTELQILDIDKNPGTYYVTTDMLKMYYDSDYYTRNLMTRVVVLTYETDRSSITNPNLNYHYYVFESNTLYVYNGQWNIVVSDPSNILNEYKIILSNSSNNYYQLSVSSSNGIIFNSESFSTLLTATLYENGTNNTSNYSSYQYSWTRLSDQSDLDSTWNSSHANIGNSLSLTQSDVVDSSSTFTCIFYDESGSQLASNNITLSVSIQSDDLLFFATSNQNRNQIYYKDINKLNPDWSVNPYLVLTPHLYISASSTTDILESSSSSSQVSSFKWLANGNTITNDDNHTALSSYPWTLTVKSNDLLNDPEIIYSCIINWTDPDSELSYNKKSDIIFSRSDSVIPTTLAIASTPNGNIFKDKISTPTLNVICNLYRGVSLQADDSNITYTWFISLLGVFSPVELSSNALAGSNTLVVNNLSEIKKGSLLLVGTESVNTVQSIDTSNNTLTLLNNISNNYNSGTVVSDPRYDSRAGDNWSIINANYSYGITNYDTDDITVPYNSVPEYALFKCIIQDTDTNSLTYDMNFDSQVSLSNSADNITISISSTNGGVFKNGLGSTTLVGDVWRTGSIIDSNGSIYNYLWSEYDASGNQSESWSKTGKSINITQNDILGNKTTFVLEIYDSDNDLVSSGQYTITILNENYSAILTNYSVVLPADSDGNNIDYTNASTEVIAYLGKDTIIPTIGTLQSTNCSASVSGLVVTLSSITSNSGNVIIPVSYNGNSIANLTYSFSIQRSAANGTNGYTVVLSLENTSFIAESDGSISIEQSVSTDVQVYEGSTQDSEFTIGDLPDVPGLSLSKDSNTVDISALVGTNLANSGSFSIPITVNGITIDKTFSWNKSLKGANGEATTYWLNTSDIVITRSASDLLTPSSITVTSYTQTGNTISDYLGRFIIQESTDGSTYTTTYTSGVDQSSYVYTPTSYNVKFINVSLYQSGDTTTLLDTRSIAVIFDGNVLNYSLSVSSLVFSKSNSGVYTPSSVLLSSASKLGSNAPESYSGRFRIDESIDGSTFTTLYESTNDESSYNYTPSANIKLSRIYLYTSGGFTDQVDDQLLHVVSDGSSGANAVVGVLSNDNCTLAANSSGSVSDYSSATTTIYIYNGTSNDTSNWSFTATPSSGVTGSLSSNTYTVSSMSNDTGYVDIEATRSGYSSVIQRFSLSKARQGEDGHTFEFDIVGGSLSVTYDDSGLNPSPSIKPFSCILYKDNNEVSPDSYLWSASGLLSGTSTINTFTPDVSSSYSIEDSIVSLSATYQGQTFTKSVSVSILKIGDTGSEGVSALYGVLDNDSVVIPTESDGSNGNYSDSYTDMYIYIGITEDTPNWSFEAEASSGITGSFDTNNTNKYIVTNMTTDSGYVDIVASKNNYPSITKRFNLSKSKSGQNTINYYVSSSNLIIKESNSGVYTPSSITVEGYKQIGSISSLYSGRFIIYESIDGSSFTQKYISSVDESSHTYTPSSGVLLIKVELYQSGNTTTLYDTQSITIISDGENGSNGINGDTYSLNIIGTTSTITYDSNGLNPNSVNQFSCALYKNGSEITPASYLWSVPSSNSSLSGSSNNSTFTPTVSSTYSSNNTNNVVMLTVVYNGQTISQNYPIAMTKVGSTGATGASGHTYTLAIINGSRSVLYNSSGSSPNPSTSSAFGCTLTQDGVVVTPTSYSWSVSSSNSILSGSSTTSTFTPTISSSFTTSEINNYVQLSVSYNNQTITEVVPISVTQIGSTGATGSQGATGAPGTNGNDATNYSLIVSSPVIKRSTSGSYTPSQLVVSAQSVTGTNSPVSYNGIFKIYESSDGGSTYTNKYTSSSNESSHIYTPSSGISTIKTDLYLSGGSILLDEQITTIVSDGSSGNTYTLVINGGTSTITYDSNGLNPNSISQFSCTLYQNGAQVTPSSYSWSVPSSNSALSGSSTSSTFTPTVSSSYVSTNANNNVSLSVVYNSQIVTQNYSIAMTKVGTTGATGSQGATGATGSPGSNGHTYVLVITGGIRTVTYDQNGNNPGPSQTAFGVTLTQDGSSVTPSSYSWSSTGNLSGTGTSSTFTPNAASSLNTSVSNTVSVSVSYNGQTISDTIPVSMTKVGATGSTGAAGTNAISSILSNTDCTVSTDSSGNNGNYTYATTTMYVYSGTVDISSQCTFSVSGTTGGVTYYGSNNTGYGSTNRTYSVTGMTSDEGTITIQATYSSTTLTQVFTVSKSKQGSTYDYEYSSTPCPDIGFDLKGYTANQVIINGDFTNGTNNWSAYNSNSSVSVSGNYAVFSCNNYSGDTALRVYNINLHGHRVYVRYLFYYTGSSVSFINTDLGDSSAYVISNPSVSTNYLVSTVINFTATNQWFDILRTNPSSSQTSTFYIDLRLGVVVIDMGTDSSNPLYNLTESQMNSLFPNYFEGLKSTTNPTLSSHSGNRNLLLGTSKPFTWTGNGGSNSNSANLSYQFSEYPFSKYSQASLGNYLAISFDWVASDTVSNSNITGTFMVGFNTAPWWESAITGVITISQSSKSGHFSSSKQMTSDFISGSQSCLRIRLDNVPITTSVTISNVKYEISPISELYAPAPEDVQSYNNQNTDIISKMDITGVIPYGQSLVYNNGSLTKVPRTDANPNIIPNSSFLYNYNGWSLESNTPSSVSITNGMLCMVSSSSGASGVRYTYVSLLPSTPYTFSVDLRYVVGEFSVFIVEQKSQGTDTSTYTDNGHHYTSLGYLSFTFTTQSDTEFGIVYLRADGPNYTYYLNYAKLEQGSYATPWCPNTADITDSVSYTGQLQSYVNGSLDIYNTLVPFIGSNSTYTYPNGYDINYGSNNNLFSISQLSMLNWTYIMYNFFSNINYNNYSNSFIINSAGGWEQVYTSLSLTPGVTYTLSFGFYCSNSGGSNNYPHVQILNAVPTDGNNSSSIIYEYGIPTPSAYNTYSVSFTPSVSTIWIDFQFGFMADGQVYNVNINNLKLEQGSLATPFNPTLTSSITQINNNPSFSLGTPSNAYRYIRDYANGSTADLASEWLEIQAYNCYGNIALGCPVSASFNSEAGPLSLITDGNYTFSSWSNVVIAGSGLQCVQVDLGSLQEIDSITIWHIGKDDGRSLHSNKTQVSADGYNWITIFDSSVSGEYEETASGHTISVPSLIDYATTAIGWHNTQTLQDQWYRNKLDISNIWSSPARYQGKVGQGALYATLNTLSITLSSDSLGNVTSNAISNAPNIVFSLFSGITEMSKYYPPSITINPTNSITGYSSVNTNGETYYVITGMSSSIDNAQIIFTTSINNTTLTQVCVVSKSKAGPLLDWVTNWDGTKAYIGNNEVVTPKLFAGSGTNTSSGGSNPSLTGVAIGSSLIASDTSAIIAGMRNNIETFSIHNDGTFWFGNSSTGLVYNGSSLSMSGSVLISGTVTADKLIIGDTTNLASCNEITGANVSNSWTKTYISSGYILDSMSGYFFLLNGLPPISCNPNDQFYVEFYGLSTTGSSITTNLVCGVWSTSTDNGTGWYTNNNGDSITFTTTESKIHGYVNIPNFDPTVALTYNLGFGPMSAANSVKIRKVFVRRVTGSTYIANNSITTSKLSTTAITSSNNYSWLRLDDGTFNFGNGALTWNGSTLSVIGSISASSTINGTSASTVVSNASTAYSSVGVNKWLVRMYNISGKASSVITYETVNSSVPYRTFEYDDTSVSIYMDLADNYVGYATTYVYCNSSCSISTSIVTDDNGVLYVNNSLVVNITSCMTVNITINLQSGWNQIDVIWAEGGGGDGFQFGSPLSSNSNISKMYCYQNTNPVSEGRMSIAESYINNNQNVINNWSYNGNNTYIDGGHLYTNTVTADKLYVGDMTNLWNDPDYEGDALNVMPSSLQNTQGQVLVVSNPSGTSDSNNTSSKCLRIQGLSSSNNDSYQNNKFIPCQPGDMFYFSCWIRWSGTSLAGTLCFGYQAANSSGILQGTWVAGASSSTYSTSWVQISGTSTIQSGVYYIRPWLSYQGAGNTSYYVYVDNLVLRKVSKSATIDVNGLINAINVSTQTLYAQKISTSSNNVYGTIGTFTTTNNYLGISLSTEGFIFNNPNNSMIYCLSANYYDGSNYQGASLSSNSTISIQAGSESDLYKNLNAYLEVAPAGGYSGGSDVPLTESSFSLIAGGSAVETLNGNGIAMYGPGYMSNSIVSGFFAQNKYVNPLATNALSSTNENYYSINSGFFCNKNYLVVKAENGVESSTYYDGVVLLEAPNTHNTLENSSSTTNYGYNSLRLDYNGITANCGLSVSGNLSSSLLVITGATNQSSGNNCTMYNNGGGSIYIGSNAGVKIVNSVNNAWADIAAGSFTNNSLLKNKQNIESLEKDISSVIRTGNIYKYNHKYDVSNNNYYDRYGFIIDADNKYGVPKEVLSETGEGVNLYSMCSLLWESVKNLYDKIDKLNESDTEINSRLYSQLNLINKLINDNFK